MDHPGPILIFLRANIFTQYAAFYKNNSLAITDLQYAATIVVKIGPNRSRKLSETKLLLTINKRK